jgi:hypothetical protein
MYEVNARTKQSVIAAVDSRRTTEASTSMWKSRFFATAVLLAASAGYALAQGKAPADFQFENVADTTQGFTGFATFPAINDHGAVAFEALRAGVEEGIFRWQDGSMLQLAKSSPGGLSLFGGDPAINAGGTVAYEANLASGARVIFTSDGVTTKTIANTIDQGLVARFLGSPSINRSGTVAFLGIRTGFTSRAIFVGDGGPLTPVVETSNSEFIGFQNAAINASDQVVTVGNRADGSAKMFVLQAGKHPSDTPIIAIDTNDSDFGGFGDPVINKSGTIANDAFRNDDFNAEILSADQGGVTDRTDITGATFVAFDHPSINDSDAVAFLAFEVDGNSGVFIELTKGASPIPVIRTGDALFGSIVTSADIGRFALNKHFEMAIQYTLEDGRSGVAIASLRHGRQDDDSQ